MAKKGEDNLLKVNFAGLELHNPVILASATPGWDGEHSRRAARAGAGAVVPKSIGPPSTWAQHPRSGRFRVFRLRGKPMAMLNLELYTTITKEEWVKRELEVAASGGAPVIASLVANPDLEQTEALTREVSATGFAAMIELNVSCPMPSAREGVGYRMGNDPERTLLQTKAARAGTSLPLAVKLTPNVSDMVEVAQRAKEGGADALVISNSVRAFAGVDINTGEPILPAFGGYTGPAIKPIIQRFVAEVAREVQLPISAVGGIGTWQDVVEYIMLGATTVQVCTSVMWEHYDHLRKLVEGLRGFVRAKGYSNIEEFRGVALRHLTTIEEYARRPAKVAALIQDLCTNCRLCGKVCFYDAIEFTPDMTFIPESCDGCGLCLEFCPTGAIRMEERHGGK